MPRRCRAWPLGSCPFYKVVFFSFLVIILNHTHDHNHVYTFPRNGKPSYPLKPCSHLLAHCNYFGLININQLITTLISSCLMLTSNSSATTEVVSNQRPGQYTQHILAVSCTNLRSSSGQLLTCSEPLGGGQLLETHLVDFWQRICRRSAPIIGSGYLYSHTC